MMAQKIPRVPKNQGDSLIDLGLGSRDSGGSHNRIGGGSEGG